jgi:hypothetical protein
MGVLCCGSACEGYGDVWSVYFWSPDLYPDGPGCKEQCPILSKAPMFPKLQRKSARSDSCLEIYFRGGQTAGGLDLCDRAVEVAINAKQ